MRLNRFFSSTPLAVGSEHLLDPEAARHATTVLRLKPGAPLILFDGRGGEYRAELLRGGKQAAARVLQYYAIERESPLDITLVQGIAKGEKMDYLVQKAVELGVTRIVPLASERGVVKLRDTARAEKKRQHWQNVAISACEQCGRNRVPMIESVTALPAYLASQPAGLRLLLDPEAGENLTARQAAAPRALAALVGPEGGLSNNELEFARRAGFGGVRIGPRVLRTETAGLALLAAVQTLWGDYR